MKICVATKADGNRCEAAAVTDSDYCFFHDPSKAAERREAQAEGGRQNRMRTLDSGAQRVNIQNSKDVMVLLCDTIDQVLTGKIDPRIGYTVGYLAHLYLKAREQERLEEIASRERHFDLFGGLGG